ncbi:MAG: hypothetical protein JWQ66_1556 [Mucilaginibacter sp.]|nr:hypothetical protein [Mucilaginibacter sp.]
MKTKLLFLLCLGFLLTACKKTKVVPNTAIKGTWELRATRNGNIMPATYAPGNSHLLSFGNSTFAEYNTGTVLVKGTYKTSTNSSVQYTISSSTNSMFTNGIILQKDTLELIPGMPDISTGFYVKTSSDSLAN